MDEPAKRPERRGYSAESARQGEIILRTRGRRVLFIAGLVGIVLVAVALKLAAAW